MTKTLLLSVSCCPFLTDTTGRGNTFAYILLCQNSVIFYSNILCLWPLIFLGEDKECKCILTTGIHGIMDLSVRSMHTYTP